MGLLCCLLALTFASSFVQAAEKPKVMAFYTGKNDKAHISFDQEAIEWFAKKGAQLGFEFEATSDWTRLNPAELSQVQLLVFLDTRPEEKNQRDAFQGFMENGGAWMGFHFSAFALTPSTYPQDWDWYHEQFLGSGQYGSNTWRPTSARLMLEKPEHPIAENLPELISSSPNEWYRWEHDLRKNGNIEVLLSIDPSSFPLGTGPKAHEIWHEGDFPVVWTNKNYRMVYFNMGHNDMDYEGGTNLPLSHTFGNSEQDQLVQNALLWLLDKKSAKE